MHHLIVIYISFQIYLQVLEMVTAWLKHDWTSRQCHATDLLKMVRLGFVPDETIRSMLGDDILGIPECKQLVEKVHELQASNQRPASLAKHHPGLFATRSVITVSYS